MVAAQGGGRDRKKIEQTKKRACGPVRSGKLQQSEEGLPGDCNAKELVSWTEDRAAPKRVGKKSQKGVNADPSAGCKCRCRWQDAGQCMTRGRGFQCTQVCNSRQQQQQRRFPRRSREGGAAIGKRQSVRRADARCNCGWCAVMVLMGLQRGAWDTDRSRTQEQGAENGGKRKRRRAKAGTRRSRSGRGLTRLLPCASCVGHGQGKVGLRGRKRKEDLAR